MINSQSRRTNYHGDESLLALSLETRIKAFFLLSICSNDVYDFDTGADKNKKESVVNLIGR